MRAAIIRIYEKCRKKVVSGVRLKLTLSVLPAVIVVFFVLSAIYIVYYKNMYLEREIRNQREQMEQAVYGISTIQSTVKNISQQIVVSETVQGDALYSAKSSVEYFVASDKIEKALGTYTFIVDDIQEIMLYTKDGRTYSSFLSRYRFDPSQEQWYLDFKQTGEDKGYTKVHTTTVTQNGRTCKVISYVLTYYSVSDYGRELGDLVISLDYASMEKMAALNMSLLEGYAIYDKHGECILKNGEIGMSYSEIQGVNGNQFMDGDGNIYLISNELKSDWIMVTEISGDLLKRQRLFIEIPNVLMFTVLAFLIVFMLSHNIKKVVEPINRLSLAAEQFGAGNFDVFVDVSTGDEVEILADAFNKMVKDVQHYTEMSVEQEKIIRRSQVDQLLLQINPHFIYNTMNSIVYMARIEGNKDIERFVNAFISLLQNMLRVENQVFTSLEEEIKNVENYLILQKYRYMDKFAVEINCPEELKTCLVPRVILQPIIENAIFHGIAPMQEKGKLMISVELLRDKLRIVVEDNGIGMSEEMVKQLFHEEHVGGSGMRKIGVANVYHRIKEICGEKYGLYIKSREGTGTRVIIDLPPKAK